MKWKFNTAFLLLATVVTALACLPMAFDKREGYVWTAFLFPISLACLAAARVAKHGQFEFKFKELPGSVVEIYSTGGRQNQWFTRFRIITAGGCLSLVCGFPMLHTVDPEPPQFWLPFVAVAALSAVALLGLSARRTVRARERQIVTDYLLFGRRCWWSRRWQVRDGDSLAVLTSDQMRYGGTPTFRFWHALFVRRAGRRQKIVDMYANEPQVADLELVAHRVAALVDVNYEGPRKAEAFWWRPKDSPPPRIDPLLTSAIE